MRVQIVVPPPRDLENGNRRTGLRWAEIFRELGHESILDYEYENRPVDLLIALHAVKNYPAMRRFHFDHPGIPIVVALTGTDVYGQEHYQASLDLADRIVVLQRRAFEELDPGTQERTRVIYQSAPAPTSFPEKPADRFQVAAIGHLRPVKDPFRPALAVRALPDESRIQVIHVGRALDPAMESLALTEVAGNPRYRWIGEQPQAETERILLSSHLLVISSEHEGSSNVLTEALASRVPVIATQIPGLEATLGADYSGLYPFGDTEALTRLLHRAETDPRFYRLLETECQVASRFSSPQRELEEWRQLLGELFGARKGRGDAPTGGD